MGRWLIFLILLGIASENGLKISGWVWATTISITTVGIIAVTINVLKKELGKK